MIVSLHLYNYNNYYNRITSWNVPDLDIYNNHSGGVNLQIDEILNWNENDGVDTTTPSLSLNDDSVGKVNYAVAVRTDVNPNVIISRWFVVEATYTRSGQYILSLHRDLLVDFQIIWRQNNPVYVEKGYVPSTLDPAIYNRENISLNEIKKSERLLKDKTGCPWIVGYLAKGKTFGTVNEEGNATLTFTDYGTPPDINSPQTMEAWLDNYQRKIIGYRESSTQYRMACQESSYGNFYYQYWTATTARTTNISEASTYAYGIINLQSLKKTAGEAYRELVNSTEVSQLEDIDGKTIQFTDTINTSKYRIHAKTKFIETGWMSNTAVDNFYKSVVSANATVVGSGTLTEVSTYKLVYDITLEDIGKATVTYSLTSAINKKIRTKDAPYDIFAIPLSDEITFKRNSDAITIKPKSALSMLTATEIAKDTTTVYDVQIVPYCPIQNLTFNSDGSISTPGQLNVDYDIVTKTAESGNSEENIVFYAEYSSFSSSIELTGTELTKFTASLDPENFKLDNQCKKYRVCAPNYSSAFQISIGDNQGISRWNISCTYLPYSPYIHVYPDWGGLYGDVERDSRGLIYTGNMSISTTSDAWRNYVVQNSNYQNIFDREVQNLLVVQGEQEKLALANLIAAPITGGVQGGLAGAKGGGVAAAAGAILGAASSGIGAGMDFAAMKRLNAEALNYKTDMYNMSLGNIKALPNTLSKVTAFNIDNKYFPFVEEYECTETEREALKNKMRYNGMTINRIGIMENFLHEGYYHKGRLIRCEGLVGDTHLANALSDELYKGFFLKESLSNPS